MFMNNHLKEFQKLNASNQSIFDADLLIILKDGTNLNSWSDVDNDQDILYISEDLANVNDLKGRYKDLRRLKAIVAYNVSDEVTSLEEMFMNCHSLSGVCTLNSWDVSNVGSMSSMFFECGSLGDVSFMDGWNVSNVKNMKSLFDYCFSLGNISALASWDVSSVKTICDMFDDCHALKTIGDVSHWNTANLIDAGGWLNWAKSFVGNNEGVLDLSGWNTQKLKAAGEMFLKTQIRIIDLTGWTFDSITNDRWEGAGRNIYYETGNDSDTLRGFGQMFKDTKKLTTVYVSQACLDSFNAAVEREVNTVDMWTNSKCERFSVK